MTVQDTKLMDIAADIVSAYVRKNSIPARSVPHVLETVHAALTTILDDAPHQQPALIPAVPIKKSVGADYLICLEDGKRFKTLRRHLKSVYGLTPEAYREKWGLRSDYPMVAPGYSSQRSALARSLGLGRKRHVIANDIDRTVSGHHRSRAMA